MWQIVASIEGDSNSNQFQSSAGCANYHFIKDKAYTEDDVLVYNVFVHNVPKKVGVAMAFLGRGAGQG